MSLSPIIFHYFPTPIAYLPAYHLQQAIHDWQLTQRRQSRSLNRDVILMLQHRPVYTTGRRQTDDETKTEEERLTHLGADFVRTKRGGQTTYHGPGQLVVYPLIDLARHNLSIRDYICALQTSITRRFKEHHGIDVHPSDNTGVFLNAHTKLASIGVQVQHRLTTHGLAVNVTKEPKAWFDQVVACGLADVKAGSISDVSVHGEDRVTVQEEAHAMKVLLSSALGSEIEDLDLDPTNPNQRQDPSNEDLRYLRGLVTSTHTDALDRGPWYRGPLAQ